MKFKKEYFYCSPRLLQNVDEINEIDSCISIVKWEKELILNINSQTYEHQSAYNKAFEIEFAKFNWTLQPLLYNDPKLIGDFQKNDIFIEVQFGNSATLYRDY